MTARSDLRVGGLYIHVPFCARKCEYCAFYSEAAQGELVQRYTSALCRELELVAAELSPQTVFFGGGTPSLLNLAQWTSIFKTMDRLNLLGAEEWTVESNPATVSLDKAKLWREHGVNRVSMGVQSLDEVLLDRLGRVHSRDMVFRSFDVLRKAGFENINIDLMFAIPGQTMEIWRQTLDEATAMGSEHMSSYEVIYEEDTPLFEQLSAGEFDVDEELACALHEELIDRSAAAGFVQYEVANFARDQRQTGATPGQPSRKAVSTRPEVPALACRHNLNYWHGGAYFGLGPSAAGYVNGVRTKNWSNTQLHCEQIEKGHRAFEWSENLPPIQRAGETAAFGLRTNVGWQFTRFNELTGFDLRREWNDEIQQLSDRGWAESDDTSFRLTRAGLRFADAAAAMFLR